MEPRKVIPALQADGHEVIAVQYGLDSFEEDVATVKRTLNRVGSPVILVGHSYGGATITAAGVDDRVAGLVYIGAVAPDVGETVQQQLDKYPSDIFSRVEVADGRAWMLPNGTEFFAGDLSEEEQKLVWATHYAPVADLFHQQKIKSTPWKSKPSWYILTTQDHTVHPDLQRWVSKRMGATVVEVESSHVPMLSKPDVVIDVVRKAAAAVQANKAAA
jgi:pimeloyl-ACP methyl ester carboxylesterase